MISNEDPPRADTDSHEVAKFDRLADDWWDPHGDLKTLHALNPVRLAFIETAVELNGKRVLDVGCGGGLLCEAMAAKGAGVIGIDASEGSIRIAREHSGEHNIEYRIDTLAAFANTGPRPFDVITCMELLEHVPDAPALIEQMAALLKPGGHLFLSTLNRNLRSYVTAVIGAEYLLKLLPRGTHDYARFIRPPELAAWLRRNGLTVITISGMQYLPGLNRTFLSASPSVNYLVHARSID